LLKCIAKVERGSTQQRDRMKLSWDVCQLWEPVLPLEQLMDLELTRSLNKVTQLEIPSGNWSEMLYVHQPEPIVIATDRNLFY
jgi:hypothetical protein